VQRITTIARLRTAVADERGTGRRIVLVPTMGALHAGHVALVEEAHRHGDTVVVSVFVNPAQFDRPDDLKRYPRDLDGDEAALAALGDAAPTILFAPEVAEVYPAEARTTVHVSGLTEGLCGSARPGHFDGVATVVAKLLNMVQPDAALFGRKDFQQLQVIRRLVTDLDLPVSVVAVPTVREDDGVALSSRNRLLSPAERRRARVLPRALAAAVHAARGGDRNPAALREAVVVTLATEPDVDVEYAEVVDPTTLTPPRDASSPQLLVALAAHLGAVRLIDNVVVGDPDDEDRLLAAVGGAGDRQL
jgi:pantoate--beta-alanine ligase